MSKLEKERDILSASIRVLEKLYGKFDIDEKQIDRPDAAIVLENGNKITLYGDTHRKVLDLALPFDISVVISLPPPCG